MGIARAYCCINCGYRVDRVTDPFDYGMDGRVTTLSFKFARQRSKLAGTIRGSYFVIKGEY